MRMESRKYDLIKRRFERKYQMDFFSFKNSDLMKTPSWETEEDYFNWELAVTKLEELREEIERLTKS